MGNARLVRLEPIACLKLYLALGAPAGKVGNAATKLLMKQDGSTIESVVTAFGLSAEERQFLLGAGKGEGLLFARGTHLGVRVEASPGYLYYAETARAIKSALPNARIVVSLREQVAWLISWFKTLKALSLLEAALDFDEFIDAQVTDTRPWRQRPHGYRAVDHGYYAKFVEQYVDVFGADKVLVTWFDDLTNTPRDVMRKVCTFASLDPAAYDSYEFRRVNPSVKLRSQRSHEIYSRLRRGTVRLASVRPRTSEAVKRLLPRIDARFYGRRGPTESRYEFDAERAVRR